MNVEVGLTHCLLLGALLFAAGAVCVSARRNALGALVGVGLMLDASAVNFVAFARFNPDFRAEGWVFALVALAAAAAGAGVGAAAVRNFAADHGAPDGLGDADGDEAGGPKG